MHDDRQEGIELIARRFGQEHRCHDGNNILLILKVNIPIARGNRSRGQHLLSQGLREQLRAFESAGRGEGVGLFQKIHFHRH